MPNLDTSPLISEKSRALKGVIIVPGDKSISHRALMFASMAIGESAISGLLEAENVTDSYAYSPYGETLDSQGTTYSPFKYEHY